MAYDKTMYTLKTASAANTLDVEAMASRESQIPHELARLAAAVEFLEQRSARLRDRLDPVCLSKPVDVPKADEKPLGLCKIAEAIHAAVLRIENLQRDMDDLARDLEV